MWLTPIGILSQLLDARRQLLHSRLAVDPGGVQRCMPQERGQPDDISRRKAQDTCKTRSERTCILGLPLSHPKLLLPTNRPIHTVPRKIVQSSFGSVLQYTPCRSGLLSLFFFLLLVLSAIADAECRSDTVDLADTYLQVKMLSQFHLDGG